MKTVLVVEDEFDLLHTLCSTLEMGGYRPVPASHGRAALDAIEGALPDLVLTDVMMPYMSGYELVQEIRKRPEGDTIPIVVMSAIEAGSHPAGRWNALLSKPFSLDQLLDTVERLIGEPEPD